MQTKEVKGFVATVFFYKNSSRKIYTKCQVISKFKQLHLIDNQYVKLD